MENYTKGETRTVYDPPQLHIDGAVEMKVTNASKIRNIMESAMASIEDNNIRHMTWSGSGNAINKTISCVEIMKRKVKGLHQITQIGFLRVEDFWESTVEGLDTLKVNKNIPAISILLSKDPLDSNDPRSLKMQGVLFIFQENVYFDKIFPSFGPFNYQAPGATNVVWAGVSKSRRQSSFKKNVAAVKDLKSAASKPKWNKRDRKDGSRVSEKQASKKKPENGS